LRYVLATVSAAVLTPATYTLSAAVLTPSATYTLSAAVLTPSATYNLLLYSSYYHNCPVGIEEGLHFTGGMAEILLNSIQFTAAVLTARNYSTVFMRFLIVNMKVALLAGLY
jgi:hypothetical protein